MREECRAAGGSVAADAGPGTALVVVPRGRKRQRAALAGESWTTERRSRFFDHFAMTGDVARSAALAGMTSCDAYAMRRRSASFAELWRRALDVGYDRLEAAVIRQVLGQTNTKVDVAAAMLLLERHRAATASDATAKRAKTEGGAVRERAERELLRRLEAFAKRPAPREPS